MTSFQPKSISQEIAEADELSLGTLAYMEARLKSKTHSNFLALFMKKEQEDGFTKAKLSKRSRILPPQLSTYINGPGNWTFNTLARLAAALGYEAKISFIPIKSERDISDRNQTTSSKTFKKAITYGSQEIKYTKASTSNKGYSNQRASRAAA